MILHVARKEVLELLRDGRMRWLASLLALLLAAAFALGWAEQQRVSAERAEALRGERENWLEQGEKNPHGAAHDGMHVFKPLSPLAFFDPGVDGYLGTSVRLESHRQNHMEHPPAADFSGLQRFGTITPAFLLQAMVPLLLILAAFAAFAGEREQGTLRQALSSGATPQVLFLGKFLAVIAVIGGVLAVAFLAAGGWMVLRADAGSRGAEAGRLLALAAGYILYGAGFVALTLAVSARVRAARTALVVMLGFWTVTTFVVPRLIPHVIGAMLPLPRLEEFDRKMQEALAAVPDGHNTHDSFVQNRVAEILRQHNVRDPAQLPFNLHGLILQEGEERAAPVIDRHFGELWDRIEKQGRLRLWLGAFAPSLAIEAFSMAMAGTDYTHHRHFAAAAEQQRRVMIKTLNEDMMYNSKFGDWQYVAGRQVWERVPEFRYNAPGAAWGLAHSKTAALLLLAWAGITWAFAWMSVKRLQPL